MAKSHILLWLDDERDPAETRWHVFFPIPDPDVHWVRTFDTFVAWITDNGLPGAICFDHDLGNQKSGFDAAKWLTEYCLKHNKPLPKRNVQSANPIGKENITSILRTFERVIEHR